VLITPEQIQAVHHNLRRLAGTCDGARAKDGLGFNGFDAAFGRNLASSPTLSPKQALAGRKMLIKYRRQLGEDAFASMFDRLREEVAA